MVTTAWRPRGRAASAAPLFAPLVGRHPWAGAAGGPASSVVHPASPQAGQIALLWWIAVGISAVVYVLVVAAFFIAIARHRAQEGPPAGADPRAERRATRIVIGAAVATVVILAAWFGLSVASARALERPPAHPVRVEVIGHQWWWELHYAGASPSDAVTSANELHVPVGIPVQLQLASADVIHSFWVPSLDGKRDLIPGTRTTTWFRVDRPGVYRGQCAELCGLEHAHMALLVIAEPKAQFDQWLATQRAPAVPPADPVTWRGQAIFLGAACSLCHTIRGTGAGALSAPDLTHLASRRTIAAGALPNAPGTLGAWIADPHAFKRGTIMPATRLDGGAMQALVAYLRSLR
ncbi:MAG: cytochrome c oxidase subunit II [Gemmatimonadaceae bacterium]|nr:cytochrome c oxidase subunit II [Gemmatimonadaceae bacterium]